MKQVFHRHKRSLKVSLIILVTVCWVLPLLLIGAYTWYFVNNNINSQVVESIRDSVDHSVEISTGRLDTAIRAFRSASYTDTIEKAYADFQAGKNPDDIYNNLEAFLKQQYKSDEKFLFAGLFFLENPDRVYYTYSDTYQRVRDYQSGAHETVKKMSGALSTHLDFLAVDGRMYMVRNIVNRSYEPYAVMVLQLNQDVVFDSMKNVLWSIDVSVTLNRATTRLVGEEIDTTGARQNELPMKTGVYQRQNNEYLLYGEQKNRDYTFDYYVTVDGTHLMDKFNDFIKTLIFLFILLLPLLVCVIRFFYRNVSRPIEKFVGAYKQLEGGALGIQMKDEFKNREFDYCLCSFNQMSARLKEQFERIYQEEIALRDAKIMALQSQINPHFLNNTLELINWEARLSDNVKVSRMIEALSTMLDAAMDRKGRPVVHLSEELMYVDAYLYIISERLGKRLTVEKEIDKPLLDCFVPRLIMQPIIENAVEHGIEPRQKGIIIIRVYQRENSLVLEVENDTKMTTEDERQVKELLSGTGKDAVRHSASLGIRNVHQRLRMIYGDKSGLTIQMNQNQNTVSRIVIPFEQSAQK